MKQWHYPAVLLLGIASALWPSGIIPTIIPAAVAPSFKIGNSSKFQLGVSGAVSGDCATFDSNLNITGPGTGSGCGGSGAQIFGSFFDTTLSPNATSFWSLGGNFNLTTQTVADQTPAAVTGTAQALRIVLAGASASTSPDLTFKLNINGTDSAITVSIPHSSAAGVYSDLTHTASVTAGDLISIHVTGGAGSTNSGAIGDLTFLMK